MNLGKLATLLCLIVTMSALPCRGELLPGDIALTRIQGDVVALVALRSIPAGENIIITDRDWVNGSFVAASGNGGTFSIPGNLEAGDHQLIDLSNIGITLGWGTNLHFVQQVSPSHTSDTYIRHLLLVELNREGLRWQSNIPDGLIRDVTHITIREQFEGQEMDHIIKEGLLTQGLTPFKWMRALGSFRAWTFAEDYASPLNLSQWSEVKLTVNPSPGIISLPLRAQNYSSTQGELYVPMRRCFGSSGTATVSVSAIDEVGPFERWRNETTSGLNMDFTDVAFGPGVGFVAVSPNSGTILIGDGAGNWDPKDTNDTPGTNLQLSSIIHDGTAFRACSIKGDIYKSGDGVNWTQVRGGQEGEQLFRIHYLKSATPFLYVALGGDGLALFSIDGDEWGPAEIPGTPHLYGATYFGGRYVLCGSGGTIIHASNPTGSWASSTTPNTRDLFSIAAVDAGGTPTLLSVGQFGTMISNTNLENNFVIQQANTNQSLFDLIEVTRNEGADKYVFAVGANGATVVSTNGAGFQTPRFDPRAPALYALAQDNSGEEPVVYGVGEYGSLTRFSAAGASLSGSITGVDLDGEGSTVSQQWSDGDSSERYIKLTKTAALSSFRERILLQLKRLGPTVTYRLGNDESEINFFRSLNANAPPVADNYGPAINITAAGLEVVTDEDWRLSFKLINTSRRASERLFIRFEGTNLPDFDIPAGSTQGEGSTLKALERTDFIQTILRQPVESIALYEEFRPGEEVLKAQVAINNLSADPEWAPNGIFERSLGAYLQDATGLINPGIPGIGILGGGAQGAAAEEPAEPAPTEESELLAAPGPVTASASGFVFSGTAPTPPDNNPEAAELVLLSVDIGGPIEMDVRTSYDYFLVGSFYNTGTGLIEEYSMNTVGWAVTESAVPATGLSIEDDTGAFTADHYPGAQYTRSVSIDALTTEGAPLDGDGEPVEYSDAQGLLINEPASYTTYAEWVTANSLTGDDALEGADADGDNIVNLLEFVLGMDPNAANTMSGTTSSYDADRNEFTFSFTVPKELSAVTMKIKTSEDLSTWTERDATMTGSDSTTETWSATVPMGSKGFGVLEATTYTP